MVTSIIGTEAGKVQSCVTGAPAARLGPAERARLSLEVLARTERVSSLAQRHGVSRQFLYETADHARAALAEAFAPPAQDRKRVRFDLPVTDEWMTQFVLAAVLIGHASFRGVQEMQEALFDDRHLSLGTIHAIVAEALQEARTVNDAQTLGGIRVGAHDEIYQARRPVLVGADLRSTYCYLLTEEEQCDETTWGVHLLDLSRQGLAPDYTVADGGRALRAGQAAAWPGKPCHGDVFHADLELGRLVAYLDHRAVGCLAARDRLERQMARARKRGRGQTLSQRLGAVRKAEVQALALADDLRLLADWMEQDILSLAGPSRAVRQDLFDFVVRELAARERFCPHHIGPVRRALERQRDDLLAFVTVLDERFAHLAARFAIPVHFVQQVGELEGIRPTLSTHWSLEGRLRHHLRGRFHRVQDAVRQVLAETPRASSVVENLNSRLRNYFFLRREIGNDYLDLLRFFLNHRRFLRSEHPERVGKSPAELLNGQSHPHWLELLGFERFHRN